MEAIRRQPAMLQGLSRFLVEHERCGAGFDVSHPSGLGSGHISIVCRGCGARHDYATATIEFEREIEFAPVVLEPSRPATPIPPLSPRHTEPLKPLEGAPIRLPPLDAVEPAAWDPPAFQVEGPPSATPPRRGRWTRDRLITAGLLFFAIAAAVFALIRISGDVGKSSSTSVPTPATAPVPSAAPKAASTPPARPGPAAPPAKKPRTPAPPQRTVTTSRFVVTVPAAWTQHTSGGGLLLAPPGSAPVSLQVFYENNPGLTMQQMITETSAFLRSRDPGADVSGVQALHVAGDSSFKLRADGPAGSQTALAVLAGPYRYLVVESADPGTPKSLRAEAGQALDSFSPR